jgi:hypothetical protein
MKTPIFCIVAALSICLFSCKKEDDAVTKPVKFTSTTYDFLGNYDASGKPNYLLAKDPISSDLISFINENLPENIDLRTRRPELLQSSAIADIKVTQQSDIFITYVSQGSAALTNAIAFYTYPTNNPPASPKDIEKITYVFPHSGYGTPLEPGDKVKLGNFSPGTSVGFVLLQNAWDNLSKKPKNDAVHFCSNDVLNPEVDPKLKKHAVLLNYTAQNKVLIGFEDLDRTLEICDHDFNDVIIYATVNP